MATITRTPMIDDDGTGRTGTIINNAWKTEFYNQIDAVVAGLPAPPYQASVLQVNSQVLTNNDWTLIAWGSVSYDNGGFFNSGSPTRLTVPAGAGGVYLITAAINIYPPASEFTVNGKLQKSGTPFVYGSGRAMVIAAAGITVVGQIRASPGDYFEAGITHGGGVGIQTYALSAFSLIRLAL